MTKTFLVLKYELTTLLRKPGFLIIAFGLPLVGVVVLAGINFAKSDSKADAEAENTTHELQLEGFVDQSGLIESLPEDLPPETLIEFANEDQAEAALAEDRIAAYYVVPSDYLESGELLYIHPSLNPLTDDRQDWIIRQTLLFNLVGGDIEMVDRILNPMVLEETDRSAIESGAEGDCARPGMDCEANPIISLLPMMVMVLFFIAFTNGSALLIRSIS